MEYVKPTNTGKRTIARYIALFGDDNVCTCCNDAIINDCCNKCGDGVCAKESCCIIFPDRGNTTYNICKTCIDKIDSKFHLLIDMGKIEPLKKKIELSQTKMQQRLVQQSI